MNHREVVKHVRDWLKDQHVGKQVEEGTRDIDLSLSTTEHAGARLTTQTFLQVECKKTNDDIDRAIGQCLRYYAVTPERIEDLKGIPTYVAVPEDFQSLKELNYIIEFTRLPLGLLVVHYDGKVEELRKAKGRPAIFSVEVQMAHPSENEGSV